MVDLASGVVFVFIRLFLPFRSGITVNPSEDASRASSPNPQLTPHTHHIMNKPELPPISEDYH